MECNCIRISEPRYDESIDGLLLITLEIAHKWKTSVLDLETILKYFCFLYIASTVELPLSTTYLIIIKCAASTSFGIHLPRSLFFGHSYHMYYTYYELKCKHVCRNAQNICSFVQRATFEHSYFIWWLFRNTWMHIAYALSHYRYSLCASARSFKLNTRSTISK